MPNVTSMQCTGTVEGRSVGSWYSRLLACRRCLVQSPGVGPPVGGDESDCSLTNSLFVLTVQALVGLMLCFIIEQLPLWLPGVMSETIGDYPNCGAVSTSQRQTAGNFSSVSMLGMLARNQVLLNVGG